jgi:hypothetical protein
MRACKSCEVEKPLEAFYFQKRDGIYEGSCKACRNARQMESRRGKFAAQRAVQNAVRRGDLIRPGECERCGAEGALDAHHADYARKLDVDWLCRSCHRKEHV